jgi:hypothetical protein
MAELTSARTATQSHAAAAAAAAASAAAAAAPSVKTGKGSADGGSSSSSKGKKGKKGKESKESKESSIASNSSSSNTSSSKENKGEVKDNSVATAGPPTALAISVAVMSSAAAAAANVLRYEVVVTRHGGIERYGRRTSAMPAYWELKWTFVVEVDFPLLETPVPRAAAAATLEGTNGLCSEPVNTAAALSKVIAAAGFGFSARIKAYTHRKTPVESVSAKETQ